MEMAANTWFGEWCDMARRHRLDAISYDPETHTVFLGTGNGDPGIAKSAARARATTCSSARSSRSDAQTAVINGTIRSIPAKAGITTPPWTWSSRICPAQASQVLLTAPKNGFFYVIDRTNGRSSRPSLMPGDLGPTGSIAKTGPALSTPQNNRYENGHSRCSEPRRRS